MIDYLNMNMSMFHGVAMLIFWTIIFFLMLSWFDKDKETTNEFPLDVLKKRLIKGEITRKEYESLKETISR